MSGLPRTQMGDLGLGCSSGRAFTLIEGLGVIGVAGMLAALVLPALSATKPEDVSVRYGKAR